MSELTHSFALCAYKESPYLEESIKSLVNQSVKSDIIICTSTPCDYISNLANKYNLKLFVRDGKSDIRDDWNFAYNQASSDFVTIAHQDDVYESNYVEKFYETMKKYDSSKVNMFITGYTPFKNGQKTMDKNCRIKRFLRSPMKVKAFSGSKFWKKRILCVGNSICCPTASYNKTKYGDNIFTSEYKFNIDWDTFLKLASDDGYFAYSKTPSVCYRIHDGATSKQFIEDNGRITEDTIMFCKFWPEPVAKFIMHFYKKAYDTYSK